MGSGMGGGDGPAMGPRRGEGLRNDTNVFYLTRLADLGGHIAPFQLTTNERPACPVEFVSSFQCPLY